MNINSVSDDYSEVISPDGKAIYFASKRSDEKSSKKKESDENIYISSSDGSSWLPSARASENINSDFCETPLYINPAGDNLYIYAGYQNEGDIKMSVRKKDKWNSPQEIPFPVNSSDAETSFTMSPTGQEIYFVSQGGKENHGGRDIFYITKLKGRRWSKPKNAGDIINTPFDEESVAFSKKGDTLWFSSKGHNSIGGYDIFYSVRNSAGMWNSVKNAGYPVNTPWDELFYKPSPVLDSVFYFASNRKGGFGGLDIYTGRIMPFKHFLPADTLQNIVAKPDTLITEDKKLINERADSAATSVENKAPAPGPSENKDEPVNSDPAQSVPDGGAVKPGEVNFLKI
jgi:Tol biopolymer transport system component